MYYVVSAAPTPCSGTLAGGMLRHELIIIMIIMPLYSHSASHYFGLYYTLCHVGGSIFFSDAAICGAATSQCCLHHSIPTTTSLSHLSCSYLSEVGRGANKCACSYVCIRVCVCVCVCVRRRYLDSSYSCDHARTHRTSA